MSEPHDVVKLLVKRMESNPEEFNGDDGRWAQWLDELIPFVTEKERLLLRKPMMQTIHEDVMDELLNGPERRRKAEEDREYERHLAQAMQHTQRQAMQGIVGAYSGGGGGGGVLGQAGAYDYDLDRYRNAAVTHIAGEGPSLKAVGTVTAAQPEPKLKPYDKIKKALGI